MKKIVVVLLMAAVIGWVCMSAQVVLGAEKDSARVLRHVVLLKFKDGTAPARVRAIEDAFLALKDKMEVIKAIEGGEDTSPEGLQQGFTHCFIVTFADKAGLETYLPHKGHQDFVAFMKPDLDKVLVIDFWNKREAE